MTKPGFHQGGVRAFWGPKVPLSKIENSSDLVHYFSGGARGAGTALKLGGKCLPGSKLTPNLNSKLPGFGPLFFRRDPSSRKKMNDIDSPKLGGGGDAPHSFQIVDVSYPHCSPAPASLEGPQVNKKSTKNVRLERMEGSMPGLKKKHFMSDEPIT